MKIVPRPSGLFDVRLKEFRMFGLGVEQCFGKVEPLLEVGVFADRNDHAEKNDIGRKAHQKPQRWNEIKF